MGVSSHSLKKTNANAKNQIDLILEAKQTATYYTLYKTGGEIEYPYATSIME